MARLRASVPRDRARPARRVARPVLAGLLAVLVTGGLAACGTQTPGQARPASTAPVGSSTTSSSEGGSTSRTPDPSGQGGRLTVTTPAPPTVRTTTTGPTSTGETPPTTESTTVDPGQPDERQSIAGVPRQDIACGSGYVVQLASATDLGEFGRRIDDLREQYQVPDGARWGETSASCDIFSSDGNAYVLWSGPYPEPYAGCPDRVAGPADAFIKLAAPEQATAPLITCLCPADTSDPALLPLLDAVGLQHVWIGELQRILVSRLGYDIDLGPDPTLGLTSSWGWYTSATAAAVQEYQTDSGLPVTGVVDRSVWSALQLDVC
ncbi:peptidoglycan-binding domain-containing protein [Nakamurella leprariae]|uniref:Peptidoglycan-binding protein n=1 Tax=Nakamurella leprariae TaxID=2803911 RepID=A0A938YBI1_9ACTN|nr:peptidoglycan-binding domain-containing protein [Nakamurella leprariae]MBM9469440.1 peptidoglycan-binding protein [Nakamurella leprariae]